MKISSPIPIKITPPKIDAFPASLVPNFRPRHSPAMQIANVTDEELYLVCHIRILCLIFMAHIILFLFIT